MPTIRLTPSTYQVSNSALSVTNPANMYANTDSTTYATVTNTKSGTTTYYIYLRGFDFSQIPANAIINSFSVKVRVRESGAAVSSTYSPYLCNNATALSGCTASVPSTTVQTLTFKCNLSFETIKGYGSNFTIRLTNRRNSRNTTSYLYIYGAEILVDYTIPEDTLYIKENGKWKQYSEAYKKVNGVWVKQDDMKNIFDPDTYYT